MIVRRKGQQKRKQEILETKRRMIGMNVRRKKKKKLK